MKLRTKVMLIIAATLLGLVTVLYATSSRFVETNLHEQENTLMAADTRRVINILYDRLDQLDRIASDWAEWDDTYQYVVGDNPDFEAINLTDNTFPTLEVNLMVFLGPENQVVFSSGFDLEAAERRQIPSADIDQLIGLCRLSQVHSGYCVSRGLVQFPSGIMLVAARPVLTSDGLGPSHGSLIVGRYLSTAEIKKLTQLTDVGIDVYQVDSPGLPEDVVTALSRLRSYEELYIGELPPQHIAGYTLLTDLYGYSRFILRTRADRSIYQIGQASLRALVVSLVIITLAFSVVTLLLIERLVLARVTRLHEHLREVGRSGNLSGRLHLGGNDELANLGGTLNQMLSDLDYAQTALRENEARYRAIVEDQTELICRILPDGTLTFVNEAYCRYFGLLRENLIGQAFIPRIPEEDLPRVAQKFSELAFEHPVITYEHRVRLPNGETRWQQWTERAIYDENRQLQEYQLVGRDITATKQIEDRLRYLGLHDPLTTLYNRAYMESELDNIDRERRFPVTIIVADMDGLKVINDQYGHTTGDEMLIETARILQASFRPSDIVVRTGGDEFAVILPNTPRELGIQLVNNLRAALRRRNTAQANLAIELSIGMDTAATSESLLEARKQADQAMYQDKRARRPDGRLAARIRPEEQG